MVQIVFLNESMDFNNPQVLDDPKGIPIGRVDFDNPIVYVDTSISDDLVYTYNLIVASCWWSWGSNFF